MIKIDSNFTNNSVKKWEPVIRNLNFDNRLIEPVSIFAEVYFMNVISNPNNIFYESMLPMALKSLFKLNLENVKLIIDPDSNYKLKNYQIKMKITEDEMFDINNKIGLHTVNLLESKFIDQITETINDKIKYEKAISLTINGNFISEIKKFENYYLLSFSFLVIGIKKERSDKIDKINKSIE